MIDLEFDPPPDVVIEIDTTNESLWKLTIYSALGVPEVWRYDGKQAHIYLRASSAYREASASAAFPGLTTSIISDFLESTKTLGQTKALTTFRKDLAVRKTQRRKR